jgi:hypothetical protein
MKDVFFVVFDQAGVRRMTKTPPETRTRGETFVRIGFEVDAAAFRPPVLTRQIHITDWREGMDLPDPQLKEGWITEAEAAVIRANRERALVEMVQALGYDVVPAGGGEDE